MGTMEGLSDAELVRYARHLTLPQVGAEGQRRLKSATIVCVGAGGLGSPALLYLAAAGIGTLRIIDDDRVDITNLQRQIVHPTAAIGTAKVESARASLTAINPEVAIEMFDERLNADNALDLLRGSDCVIDGTDNLASRFLLNDACEVLDLPWVHASVFRFEGQVTTFNLQEGPNYRDLLPSPPPPGSTPSCAEAGVLGVLPGTMGMLQACEAIKVVLGLGEPLRGRLLLFDALAMEFREMRFSPLEGRVRASALDRTADYADHSCTSEAGVAASEQDSPKLVMGVSQMRASDFVARRDDGWKPYLLDVRRAAEEMIVTLPGTDARIEHVHVLGSLDGIPRDRDVVVYCRTGVRSNAVAAALIECGWKRAAVWNLAGGIHSWSDEIDAGVPKY